MSVILAMGLGISGIIVQEIKTMAQVGYSVVSFYAADSGVEEALYNLYKSPQKVSIHLGNCGEALFEAEIKCGASMSPTDCPPGFEIASDCNASNSCLKSIGVYQETKRAIEIKY